MRHYVYVLINPINQQPFYIGKGSYLYVNTFKRIKQHLRLEDKVNKHKYSIIKNILENSLTVEYNILFDSDSETEVLKKECELIKLYGRRGFDADGILTNLTLGGEGITGLLHTDATKRILSEKAIERNKNTINPFKDKKHTPETKQLLSSLHKERIAREGARTGWQHSVSTKEHLRKINMGRKQTAESIRKAARHGKDNGFSRTFMFISPQGDQYLVTGEFKKFIKERQLALTICKDYIDKGPIPKENETHNRLTDYRINSTGWEIKKLK